MKMLLATLVAILGMGDVACAAEAWPTVDKFLTSDYGPRCDPSSGCPSWSYHYGVDIRADEGADVYAAYAGTATYVGGTYNIVSLAQDDGYTSRYLHLKSSNVPAGGQWVTAGTKIGAAGKAGTSSVHLHFDYGNFSEEHPLFHVPYDDTNIPNVTGIQRKKGTDIRNLDENHAYICNPDAILAKVDTTDDKDMNSVVFRAIQSPRQHSLMIRYSRPEINADEDHVTPLSTTPGDDRFNFTDMNWSMWPDGPYQLEVYAYDAMKSAGKKNIYRLKTYTINKDCTGPTITLKDGSGTPFTNATNDTSVQVCGADNAGIYSIKLEGVGYSSTNYVSGFQTSACNTFPDAGELDDGSYTATVTDQADNAASVTFDIDTDSMPTPIPMNTRHGGLGDYANSTNTVVGRCTGTSSGVCGFNLSGPSFTSSRTFASAASAEVGPFRGLSQGTYTLTCTNCAGTSSAKPFFYSTASVNNFALVATSPQTTHTDSRSVDVSKIADRDSTRLLLKVKCSKDAATWCKESTAGVACEMMQLTVEGGEVASCGCSGFCNELRSEILLMPQSVSFQVKNTTLTASDFGVTVYAAIYKYGAYEEAISTAFAPGSQFQLSPGGVMVGSVAVQEVTPSYISSSPVSSMDAPIAQISVSSVGSCDSIGSAAPRQQLWRSSTCQQYFGSDVAFVVNSTVTFTYADSGGQPAVATSTLKVYQWTGSSWTTSGISQIGVSISTPPSVIIASATLARSGIYAMLFSVADTSAPTTSWSIEGSSSGFAGITFVSTYSYLVLSSTDPTVDGFASGLATTYYRIDGLPGDAYSVYSTSLSFLPGTHWVDSYAEDYAGNVSSVTRATITVTAGSVTNLSGDLQVDGNLLVGFLGSGAKAEVVARAEYDYALLVSSVDGRAMLAVDNANFVSIGTAPASGRLTLAGVAGDTALALRSGNSTAAVTGAQLAFGYDGTGELRHRLYTQHGSAANLNKLVFALWTPAAGSSATLGGLPVLSLEGSTITAANALAHVMPAGVADKELVVSNGSAMGEGDVLRWERWVPSASILKKDIRRLGRADEERAWADVAALKPVAFRRKTAAPEAALERGYIYEETPLSIRDGPGAASVDERLVNAELALKAAMRRIGELKGRIRKLKERGR